MTSVLKEVQALRGGDDFLIDARNSNRYRVTVKEPLGHTAYCFSTPIYNIHTRKIVHTAFEKTEKGYSFQGTNGSISIHQNRCVFEARDGRVVLTLREEPTVQGHECKPKSAVSVSPTLNGMRFSVNGHSLQLVLRSETKQEGIRFHSTCFSVMKEKFKPFLSVAGLYARDGMGNVSPIQMEYLDKGEQVYELSLSHALENAVFFFEVNLYEPKLFQDTTVESLHPDANNAYGAVGFIGRTEELGEQWLYSRPDFGKISDLTSEKIAKVLLHIPVLNESTDRIDVYTPEKRFCSFGSTWNKKIHPTAMAATSARRGKYLTVDVTAMFTSHEGRTLVYNEGLILRKPKGNTDFIAISTGDSYSAPQILEIQFKTYEK